MHVEWYGQSAFRLEDGGTTVFIDPFGEAIAEVVAARGMRFDYPAIAGVAADLLLVTHEHGDHNAVEVVEGSPQIVRSTAGRIGTDAVGGVLGVASEHDEVAGTERGANVLYAFTFGGLRVAHLGDLGQRELRDEQLEALGIVDLLFVPVGDGPTIGGEQAATIAGQLGARWTVPMHYRTARTSFLEPVDDFVERAQRVAWLDGAGFDLAAVGDGDGPLVIVPAAP
jgi:L-ascorbate metabolism protein UlaG (beta-lactamase superfamily)